MLFASLHRPPTALALLAGWILVAGTPSISTPASAQAPVRRVASVPLRVSSSILESPTWAAAVDAAITGKVTDVAGLPLVAVTVSVEGTTLGAITREDGTYRIGGVPSGPRTIIARRVGYTPERRSVTVANTEITLDFQLTAAATSLEGVVTTATGQQRRIELGNTVAAIDVAARKEASPLRNLGELMAAQAPGVQVLTATIAGTTNRVRIRGQSSRALSNDPIYIIDGIRMTSDVSGIGTSLLNGAFPSRANDLNPEEIETIEIVKGPSAATLYGTDAANGVIVITTRRGRAGPARWSFHGERGVNVDENDYPAAYGLVGVTPGADPSVPANLRRCRTPDIFNFVVSTSTLSPTCTLVSEHVLDVTEDEDLTFLKPGARRVFGGQLTGGSSDLRYFLSGDRTYEEGPWGLPDFDERRFDTTGVVIRDNMERPNLVKQNAFRANLNAVVNPKLDVSVSSSLTLSNLRLPPSGLIGGTVLFAATTGPGYASGPAYNPVNPTTGATLFGYNQQTPGEIFQMLSAQTVNRFIGSSSASWRPLSWLSASGDVGVDLTDQRDNLVIRAGEGSNAFGGTGRAQDGRVRHTNATVNLRGTGTWSPRTWAQLRSTGGWQFVASDRSSATTLGTGLGPGAETPQQGTVFTVSNSNRPVRTMGMYLEEQLAIRDRLYLTGAVRTDQASAFGTDFQSVYYPKASVSWILSDESFFPDVPYLNQLRLRTSVGASGVQPGLTAALKTYSTVVTNWNGTTGSGLQLNTTGNPALKPERSQEIEGGFDSRWWDDRINLEFTVYKKRTKDALVSQPVAPSAGVPSFQSNLGGMENTGVEYRLTGQLVDTRNYGFDFAFSGSNNQNKITSLGPVTAPQFGDQPGRPVGSIYGRPVTYTDANSDGHLSVSEVTLGPVSQTRFFGPNLPPVQLTLSTGAEFLQRRLRVAALFDRKEGGFATDWEYGFGCFLFGPNVQCPYLMSLGNPLRDQADAIAATYLASLDGFIEPTDYTRLREVTVMYDLGANIARRYLNAQSAKIALAGRNLALWKNGWRGIDPELVNGSGADNTSGAGAAGVWTLGSPTYYMIRLNLTY